MMDKRILNKIKQIDIPDLIGIDRWVANIYIYIYIDNFNLHKIVIFFGITL